MRQPDPRPFHLAFTRLAAQVRGHFIDVGDARGTERMPLGKQSAGNVHRNPAAERHLALVDHAAGFAVLIRFLTTGFAVPDLLPSWGAALAGICVLTMVLGNVAALIQSNVKRMMAYSAIAQAGFMLVWPDKVKFYLGAAGLDSLSVSLSASDAAYAGAVDVAVLYQASAKTAGIDIDVVREPNDGYRSDVWMKKPFSAVYWSGRPVEDAMLTTACSSGAAWNDTFWDNARFNALLVAARAELDEAKRREIHDEMQLILNEDGGAIIPMFANRVFVASNAIATRGEELVFNWDMDGERWMERWSFV